MFRLDRHIEILLLKHDCVILPGFGGFVAHHVSAHFDKYDGTMLPPKIMVGFNQSLTVNDSLLVQSYVEAYDYSYPEALSILEDEISKLQNIICEQGYFDIHAIGRLSINKDGFYEFEPVNEGILSPRLYGLSGIPATDAEFFLSQEKETPQISISKYNKYPSDIEDGKFIKISTTSLRRVMVACIVILFLMIVPFMHRNTNSHQLMSGLDTSFLNSFMPKVERTTYISPRVIANKANVKGQHIINKIAPTNNNIDSCNAKKTISTKENQIKTNIVNDFYTVVIAARITKKNAYNYVEDLHKRGKSLAQVVGEGKSRKVIYGAYSKKEDAEIMKNKLSSDEEFTTCWITKIR